MRHVMVVGDFGDLDVVRRRVLSGLLQHHPELQLTLIR